MTKTNDLLARLDKPGRVERIGHDMAELCKDAAAALRRQEAELDRLRVVEEAARRISSINTPFSAYARWQNDGNTPDADRLEEWVSAREQLQQALARGVVQVPDDDDVSPEEIAAANEAINRVVNQADEVIRLIAEAEAKEQAR